MQDILDEADTDKNGLIDYAEFANMMEPGRRFDGLQWEKIKWEKIKADFTVCNDMKLKYQENIQAGMISYHIISWYV